MRLQLGESPQATAGFFMFGGFLYLLYWSQDEDYLHAARAYSEQLEWRGNLRMERLDACIFEGFVI